MTRPTQISAPISQETKDLLEKHVKATGIKKGHLIESALRYHLRALQELPADVLIPARLVLIGRSRTLPIGFALPVRRQMRFGIS